MPQFKTYSALTEESCPVGSKVVLYDHPDEATVVSADDVPKLSDGSLPVLGLEGDFPSKTHVLVQTKRGHFEMWDKSSTQLVEMKSTLISLKTILSEENKRSQVRNDNQKAVNPNTKPRSSNKKGPQVSHDDSHYGQNPDNPNAAPYAGKDIVKRAVATGSATID